MAEEAKTQEKSTSNVSASNSGSGLEPNIAGLLCWLFAPVSSIIFLVVEKDSKFVKFHAWESMIWTLAGYAITFVLYTVVTIITLGLGACCAPILFFPVVVNIIGAIKAYNNEMWKLPVIGDFSEEQAGK
jgi:uncharacterized membrane protein